MWNTRYLRIVWFQHLNLAQSNIVAVGHAQKDEEQSYKRNNVLKKTKLVLKP